MSALPKQAQARKAGLGLNKSFASRPADSQSVDGKERIGTDIDEDLINGKAWQLSPTQIPAQGPSITVGARSSSASLDEIVLEGMHSLSFSTEFSRRGSCSDELGAFASIMIAQLLPCLRNKVTKGPDHFKAHHFKAHRLVGAWELAKLARQAAEVDRYIIAAGDFNSVSIAPPMHIIRNHANLRDAWDDSHKEVRRLSIAGQPTPIDICFWGYRGSS
ncbi:hypothetical protein BDY19DRAFT_996857 [Irpex rosettiformis]|uniref:Uncharacterized protein n=1 Tax=Irpex rosettiformis TaxID=378272 RepID=A0ACB8TU08_9APHY|nr:hypothetical protein BDY19DRAFT_996857 [Irpex rosettiformis]